MKRTLGIFTFRDPDVDSELTEAGYSPNSLFIVKESSNHEESTFFTKFASKVLIMYITYKQQF